MQASTADHSWTCSLQASKIDHIWKRSLQASTFDHSWKNSVDYNYSKSKRSRAAQHIYKASRSWTMSPILPTKQLYYPTQTPTLYPKAEHSYLIVLHDDGSLLSHIWIKQWVQKFCGLSHGLGSVRHNGALGRLRRWRQWGHSRWVFFFCIGGLCLIHKQGNDQSFDFNVIGTVPSNTTVILGCKIKGGENVQASKSLRTYISTSEDTAIGTFNEDQTITIDPAKPPSLDPAAFQAAYLKLNNPAVARLLRTLANLISPDAPEIAAVAWREKLP